MKSDSKLFSFHALLLLLGSRTESSLVKEEATYRIVVVLEDDKSLLQQDEFKGNIFSESSASLYSTIVPPA